MDKRFIVILVILVLGLGGLFLFTRNKASAPSATGGQKASVSNHIEGNKNSKVSLVVYGDFECSACEQMHPIEKQVVDSHINEISFTFRHFPLDSIHTNARAASRAAEAAGLQNKFFEMHNMLYENQSLWLNSSNPLAVFTQFATSLKLDTNKFKTDFASEAVNATINADYQEGVSKGVDGTPSYFINGKKLDNQDISSVEKFSAKIDEAIKASK